jgi:hypothetical protein
MTSVADGQAAAERFPHARHLVIANSFHVNALPRARSDCAARVVRRFLDTLETGDESCAAAVPAVRLLPRFARRAEELAPAEASVGNHAGERELRVVSAALLTAEDAIARAAENGAGPGVGLRGGTFTAAATGGGYRLTLRAIRWTEDVAVSGRIDSPGRSGRVHAELKLQAPRASGTLDLEWPTGGGAARARARGTLNGRAVAAEAVAP